MFQVFIVDDEKYIVALIRSLIDWKKLGMEVIGSANDGETALEKIYVLKPDIVIVDVQMPGFDGIEMMQRIRQANQSIRFIVISGHKSFEYLKSAIQYNVEDYLLKPINKEELEAILVKLSSTLLKQAKTSEIISIKERELQESKTKLQHYFMQAILHQDATAISIPWDEINQKYLTSFDPAGIFYFLQFKLDGEEKQIDPLFLKHLIQKILHSLAVQWKNFGLEFLFFPKATGSICLINFIPDDAFILSHTIENIRVFLIGEHPILEQFTLYIGISEPFTQTKDLYTSYMQTNSIMDARLHFPEGQTILFSQVKTDSGILPIILSDQRQKLLSEKIKSLDPDQIQPVIHHLFLLAKEYRDKDYTIDYHLAREIYNCFFTYLNQIGIEQAERKSLDQIFYSRLESCNALTEIETTLLLFLTQYIHHSLKPEENAISPAVRLAKRYICENFQKDISLSQIAHKVNLSTVYLSILFKKEVGINFLDYINQYRIAQAKNLLKSIDYTISQVAILSGFQDPRYFSKIFKKLVGVTPKDYRCRNCGKE